MNTETKTEQSHSEQQAWAQIESICEMVAKLTREGAAREYVKELSREQVASLLEQEKNCWITANDPVGLEEEFREDLIAALIDERIEPEDFEFDEEQARQEIQEDPLSIQVRGDWYTPGEDKPDPSEFEILLCTGGPAVRIRGELDGGQPDRAWIEYQDWGTPWTQLFNLSDEQQEALMQYCGQFYFGDS